MSRFPQLSCNWTSFFGEKAILSHFVKILGQKCDPRVKVQVIQALSILVQNVTSDLPVFYLLSNNHINDLIVHRFDFGDEEVSDSLEMPPSSNGLRTPAGLFKIPVSQCAGNLEWKCSSCV